MAADEQLCQPVDVVSAYPGFTTLPTYEQTSLLNVASQKVLNFCRRGFGQQNVTEYHDGKNQPSIWLNLRPVISVQVVTVNGFALDNTDGTAWNFVPKTGQLIRGQNLDATRFAPWFPAGKQNIEVQYWAGYAAVPDPVIRATVFMVKFLREQIKVTGIYTSESIGDYSYTLAAQATPMGVPSHVAALLQDYVQDDGPL